jgi:hypothetical protein
MQTNLDMQSDVDPLPASDNPLSPGRTDINPSDQPGVDELPDNEGAIPLDTDDDAPVEEEMIDVDLDNAEMDDEPNPR